MQSFTSTSKYQRGKKESLQPLASRTVWEFPEPHNAISRRTPDDIEHPLRSISISSISSPRVTHKPVPSPSPVPAPIFHFLTPPPSPEPWSPGPCSAEISLNSPPRSQAPSPSFPPFILVPPPPSTHNSGIKRSVTFSDQAVDCYDYRHERMPATPPDSATAEDGAGDIVFPDELEKLRWQLLERYEVQQSSLNLKSSASLPDLRTLPPQPLPIEFKPGDWYCPMKDCGYHNFCRKAECHRCGCPHPDRRQITAATTQNHHQPHQTLSNDWLVYVRRRTAMRKSQDDQQLENLTIAEGDWRCECGFVNFKRRSVCWQCFPNHPSNQDVRAPELPMASASTSMSTAVLFPIDPPVVHNPPPRRGEILRVGTRVRSASSPQLQPSPQPQLQVMRHERYRD